MREALSRREFLGVVGAGALALSLPGRLASAGNIGLSIREKILSALQRSTVFVSLSAHREGRLSGPSTKLGTLVHIPAGKAIAQPRAEGKGTYIPSSLAVSVDPALIALLEKKRRGEMQLTGDVFLVDGARAGTTQAFASRADAPVGGVILSDRPKGTEKPEDALPESVRTTGVIDYRQPFPRQVYGLNEEPMLGQELGDHHIEPFSCVALDPKLSVIFLEGRLKLAQVGSPAIALDDRQNAVLAGMFYKTADGERVVYPMQLLKAMVAAAGLEKNGDFMVDPQKGGIIAPPILAPECEPPKQERQRERNAPRRRILIA